MQISTEIMIGKVDLTLFIDVNYNSYDNSDCGGDSNDIDYYMTSYSLRYNNKPINNVSRHENDIDDILRSDWLDEEIKKQLRG